MCSSDLERRTKESPLGEMGHTLPSKKRRRNGFQGSSQFNDALLAKQAWRLLHNKDSLFYRVFKMKFFSHCSIWEAQESSSGSHAWHSILKGRDVLLKGAR